MKAIIKLFIVAAICLTSCDKNSYVYYIVEGRIIDKYTKEPVKDIMVSFNKYDIIPSRDSQKTQKYSPVEHDGLSDANGEFRVLEKYSTSLLYIYGSYRNESGLYKDTIIPIDFSNIPLSGKPSKNYKGDYILNIGDIELGKIN